MANVDARFGLRVKMGASGGALYRVRKYNILSSYGTALYLGDPVIVTGTSNTAVLFAGNEVHEAGTLANIEKATAGDGNKVAGSIVGFEVYPGVGYTTIHNAASTARIALVCDDPLAIFEIQADSANVIAAGDIGANANLVYTHAGVDATGLSGAELNTASMTTTATFQLKILGLTRKLGNALGTNAVLDVMINNHFYGNVVVGI